ncbi:hypothetical protein Tco_0638051 [Tanacetum coccineum]
MPPPHHFTTSSTTTIPQFRSSLPPSSTFVPLDQSLWIEVPPYSTTTRTHLSPLSMHRNHSRFLPVALAGSIVEMKPPRTGYSISRFCTSTLAGSIELRMGMQAVPHLKVGIIRNKNAIEKGRITMWEGGKIINYVREPQNTYARPRCGMFHDQGSNKEDPWRQQQVIEGCRDKEKKGFHVLVFQTEAGFLDRQQESIKEFLRILEVHVSIAV